MIAVLEERKGCGLPGQVTGTNTNTNTNTNREGLEAPHEK